MNTYTKNEAFTEGWFWQKSAWVPPKPPSQSVQASNQEQQNYNSAKDYNKRQKKIEAEEAKKAAAAAKAEAARKKKKPRQKPSMIKLTQQMPLPIAMLHKNCPMDCKKHLRHFLHP